MAHAGYTRVNFKTENEAGGASKDYGVTDTKGRRVGADLTFVKETVTKREDTGDGYLMADAEFAALPADGKRYGFRISGTRDGERFGSPARVKWFNTPTERDEAATKALAKDEAAKQKKFS